MYGPGTTPSQTGFHQGVAGFEKVVFGRFVEIGCRMPPSAEYVSPNPILIVEASLKGSFESSWKCSFKGSLKGSFKGSFKGSLKGSFKGSFEASVRPLDYNTARVWGLSLPTSQLGVSKTPGSRNASSFSDP